MLVTFEIFGKLSNEIKTSVSILNYQHILTINGTVEDVNNINKETNMVQGDLKYSEFFFQIIIDVNFDFKNKKGNIENGEYYLAEIINEKRSLEKDEEFGIYKLIFPIKFYKMS